MSIPVHEWGVRLSDALKSHLTAEEGPKPEAARALAVSGDGQTLNLAKEFTFMVKGLGITIGILLRLLAETNDRMGNEAATSDLTDMLYKFRSDLAVLALTDPEERENPAGEFSATAKMLEDVQLRFGQEQKRMANEIVAAIDQEDPEGALVLIDEKETGHYLPLHDCLVRFMADSFSWILRHFGEDELLRFHLETAEGQKSGFEKWALLSPAEFARTSAFLLKQHMGQVEVSEDDEKFVIRQTPCGSGGRFNLAGAYNGTDELPVIKTPGPLTFGQSQIPVYCSHCAIWNGTAPIRWFGYPQWVFDRPAQADGSCIMHIYKDPGNAPESYSEKVSVKESET